MKLKSQIVLCALALAAASPTFAQSNQQRCPAGQSGCTLDNAGERMRERVDEGKRRVQETNNPVKKGQEAGKTVIDCAKCGMDAVTSSGKGTVK